MPSFALAVLLLFFQLGETLEVRVTNVDVVVTDGSGHPVRGLPREQFVLEEDGRPQPLTNFAEYGDDDSGAVLSSAPDPAPAAPPAATSRPPRQVVILVDDTSLDPFMRNPMFDSLVKALPRLVGRDDEVMVASWEGSLHVRQPFTRDAAVIEKALRDQHSRGGGLQYRSSLHQAIRDIATIRGHTADEVNEHARSTVYMWVEHRRHEVHNFLEAARQLVATMSGTEGRKIFVIATGYLPLNPGEEIAEYARTKFPQLAATIQQDRQIREEQALLAREANANGVSIYTIFPDLYSGAEGFDRDQDPSRAAMTFTEMTNTQFALGDLSGATGGESFNHVRDFDAAVENFRADLSSYYSLGFSPAAGDKPHAIRVRLRDHPDYRVAARTSFVAKSADELARGRAVTALFRESRSDFPVTLTAGAPVRSRAGKYIVPLRVTMPATLTLIPDGDAFRGGYTVFVAVASEQGELAPVGKQEQPLRLTSSQRHALEGREMAQQLQLLVRRGRQTVAVVVRDEVGGSVGIARLAIDVKG